MTDSELIMARKLFVALDQLRQLPTTYGDGFSASLRLYAQARTVLDEAKREFPHMTEWTKIQVEGYE